MPREGLFGKRLDCSEVPEDVLFIEHYFITGNTVSGLWSVFD